MTDMSIAERVGKPLYLTMTGKGQNVRFSCLVYFSGDKFRIQMKTDTHLGQAYALIEIWSPDAKQWNEVWRLNGWEMSTNQRIGYEPNGYGFSDFHNDYCLLLENAWNITVLPESLTGVR